MQIQGDAVAEQHRQHFEDSRQVILVSFIDGEHGVRFSLQDLFDPAGASFLGSHLNEDPCSVFIDLVDQPGEINWIAGHVCDGSGQVVLS